MLRKKKERADREYVDPSVMTEGEAVADTAQAASANDESDDSTANSDNNRTEPESAEKAPTEEITTQETAIDKADPEEADPGAGLIDAFEAWLQDSGQEESLTEETRKAVGRIADVMRGADADEALFEIISRGCDYERAVESALETGEIKGRNASIDELQAMSLDDDGLPHPGTGCGGDRGNRAPSIFDLARGAM